jgi:hypothetical protein
MKSPVPFATQFSFFRVTFAGMLTASYDSNHPHSLLDTLADWHSIPPHSLPDTLAF